MRRARRFAEALFACAALALGYGLVLGAVALTGTLLLAAAVAD